MKKKYFWDEHPILFGTILFCGGFVLSLALQKTVSGFVLLLLMLCMPVGAVFISKGFKQKRNKRKIQDFHRAMGEMVDKKNKTETEPGYENLYRSDVVKKVIDLNKARANLTIYQLADLMEFYKVYTNEDGRYIRVNNKQQYNKTIREMVRIFSTFVPFEKVTALPENEYKPYMDEISDEINKSKNIEEKLIAYSNISNYPFEIRLSKDPILKMIVKSPRCKEYWGIIIIDNTSGIKEAMNNLEELSTCLIEKCTSSKDVDDISKELNIIGLYFLNKKEINNNELTLFTSYKNNLVDEKKKEIKNIEDKTIGSKQNDKKVMANNVEQELNNYISDSCNDYKLVLKSDEILNLLIKTLHAKEYAALVVMKDKLGNQKSLDKYIEFINYLIMICDDFQDAANWSIEVITFNKYLRAENVISKETSEKIIEEANKGFDAVQNDGGSKFRSITRIQEKYKKLNTGNQRIEISHFEIVDFLVNLADAKNNLSKDQYTAVINKYNSYRYDTELHSMNLAEYQAYAANVVIRGFNELAPYEKYSGQDEKETKKLVEEINKAYENNLELIKKRFGF